MQERAVSLKQRWGAGCRGLVNSFLSNSTAATCGAQQQLRSIPHCSHWGNKRPLYSSVVLPCKRRRCVKSVKCHMKRVMTNAMPGCVKVPPFYCFCKLKIPFLEIQIQIPPNQESRCLWLKADRNPCPIVNIKCRQDFLTSLFPVSHQTPAGRRASPCQETIPEKHAAWQT